MECLEFHLQKGIWILLSNSKTVVFSLTADVKFNTKGMQNIEGDLLLRFNIAS